MNLSRAGIAVLSIFALAGVVPCVAEPVKAGAGPAAPLGGTQRVVRLVANSEKSPGGGGGTGTAARPGPRRPRGSPAAPGAGAPAAGAPAGGAAPAADVKVGYLTVVAPDGNGAAVKMLATEDLRQQLPDLAVERGELMTITVKPGTRGGSEMVSAAVPFDGPKALARPKVYLFDGTAEQAVGAQTFTAVRLSKLGETRQALVPNRPSLNGGKPQPDEAILTQIKAFSAGDPVEVEFADGPAKGTFYVADIAPARDPIVGDFVKLANVKDATGKPLPGIVLDVDGHESSFVLPVTVPGMRPATAAAAAASHALAKRLKPGYAVRLSVRDPAAATPVIRDLKLDGDMEPTSDKAYSLFTTYVEVHFSPPYPGNMADGPLIVEYRPGSRRSDDHYLDIGVGRVLQYKEEAARLNVTADQLDVLRKTREPSMSNLRPSAQEKAQWVSAYNAFTAAKDDLTRAKVDTEMLAAAQEVAARWRKDIRDHYASLRTALSPEQVKEIIALGQKKLMVKFD